MRSAARSSLFVVAWSAGMVSLYANRGDPQWATKLPLACLFLAIGGTLLWSVQKLSKRPLPWFVEGMALPFIAGGLVYALVAARNAFRG
jgi:hypothetical protein